MDVYVWKLMSLRAIASERALQIKLRVYVGICECVCACMCAEDLFPAACA